MVKGEGKSQDKVSGVPQSIQAQDRGHAAAHPGPRSAMVCLSPQLE